MSATKEKSQGEIKIKSQGEIKIKYRKPIQQSLFDKLCCKFLKAFLFFIPPYFKKKKKKYVDVSKQEGLPYIIEVQNNTSKTVHNVELFGSYDKLNRNIFDKDGNYAHRNLKISSNSPDLSYKEILYGISLNKFKVGLTYIMSVNQNHLLQTLKIVKKMISGNLNENILTISKDPFQQQMNIVAVKCNYDIDGLTTVVIPTVEPKTKAVYYFYPDPLAYPEVKKENFGFRFFKAISDYFKKKEVKTGISKPYSIEVTNDTNEVKKDVSIFGSYKNISPTPNSAFNQDNDLVLNGVLIKSITPNISYAEMLFNILNNPFGVGFTYIRISNGNKSQILQDYKIKNQDANGNIGQKTIIPVIDPYQQQVDCLSNTERFRIDGFTELIISELQPKTAVIFQLYPEEEVAKK